MTIPFQFYITADQICRPRFEHIHFVSLNVLGWMAGQVRHRGGQPGGNILVVEQEQEHGGLFAYNNGSVKYKKIRFYLKQKSFHHLTKGYIL